MLKDIRSYEPEIINVSRKDRLLSSFSSVGNQLKWHKDNLFIKLNCLGYEDVAEVMVSHLLKFSNLRVDEFVEYLPCLVYEDGKCLGRGCYSSDFIKTSTEVTVAYLLDMHAMSYSISYDELREYLFDIVKYDVKDYLDKILCVDAITRNEDRHFKNIVFIYKDGYYKPAPVFDNGDSCLADMVTHPLDISFDTNYESTLSKPFYTDYLSNLNNNKKLVLSSKDFLNSVETKTLETLRAFETIKRGLIETKNIAWCEY